MAFELHLQIITRSSQGPTILHMRYYFLLLSILFLSSGCSSFKSGNDYIFHSASGKAQYLSSYDQALKLWNIPLEETDVKTKYGTAHVVMSGPTTGESVILFHGMDASSTMWFPNVKEISKDYRVYAIDFPLETGKSLANTNKLSNLQIALFYNEVFDYFKMKDINLLGASRGGWMATYLALQPESNIKKIILLSPAQTFGGIQKPGQVLTAVMLKLFPSQKKLASFFNSFSLYPDKIDNLYKQQFYLANVYGSSKPRFLNMMRFSDKELQSLKIPVLVLVGDHDIVNNEKALIKAHQLIPNVETAYIKNAGHFLSIDQADTVNTKIVRFLKNH